MNYSRIEYLTKAAIIQERIQVVALEEIGGQTSPVVQRYPVVEQLAKIPQHETATELVTGAEYNHPHNSEEMGD